MISSLHMHLGHYLHCARRQDDSCVEGRPIFHPGYQIGLPGLSDYRMHPNKVVAASQQKSLRIEMAGPFQWEPPMETAPGNSPRLACQTAFAKDRHTADNESGFPSIPADANVTRAVQSLSTSPRCRPMKQHSRSCLSSEIRSSGETRS